MISFMQMYRIGKFIEIESRLMIAKGWEGGRCKREEKWEHTVYV